MTHEINPTRPPYVFGTDQPPTQPIAIVGIRREGAFQRCVCYDLDALRYVERVADPGSLVHMW